MAFERPFLGWLTVAFFGLGIPVSLLMMLLPNSTYLRLDEEGFEMGSFVRRHKFKWTDVADFRIGSISGAKMIAIIFHPEYKQQQLGRAVAATLSGMEAAISNQYNATLEQILEALTTWRQRYGRRSDQPRLQPESQYVVRISEFDVSCARPDGNTESVAWDDLRQVEVVTTDQGPFRPDVFWVLHGSSTGCVVPQGATGEPELLVRLQQLPGFRNRAVIDAMCSADNRRFLCWEKAGGAEQGAAADGPSE
jgi:hypothetical protein